jgi:hypothetical protein
LDFRLQVTPEVLKFLVLPHFFLRTRTGSKGRGISGARHEAIGRAPSAQQSQEDSSRATASETFSKHSRTSACRAARIVIM